MYLAANVVTFTLRFVIFHYVLFADRTTAARAAATGPDAVPPGTRNAPSPADVTAAAASDAAPTRGGDPGDARRRNSDGPAAKKSKPNRKFNIFISNGPWFHHNAKAWNGIRSRPFAYGAGRCPRLAGAPGGARRHRYRRRLRRRLSRHQVPTHDPA